MKNKFIMFLFLGLSACVNVKNNTFIPSIQPQVSIKKYPVQLPAPHLQQEIQEALLAINQVRKEKGLNGVELDPNLSAYAQKRAEELLQNFSHTRPNGQIYHHEIVGVASGENIAGGNLSGKATVLKQWKKSKGHYQNMIGNYQIVGLGLVEDLNRPYKYYWVLILSSKGAQTPYYFQ